MTGPLKVLHVHSGNLFGGVETMLLTIARHQDATPNTRHSFALCFDGHLRERLARTDATHLDLGPVRASRPWTVLRARRRLRSVIHEQSPAIVICHAPWAQAVFGPAVRDAGRPDCVFRHSHRTIAAKLQDAVLHPSYFILQTFQSPIASSYARPWRG